MTVELEWTVDHLAVLHVSVRWSGRRASCDFAPDVWSRDLAGSLLYAMFFLLGVMHWRGGEDID